ncbi:MAG: hypothetical protein KBG28_15100 [Kofleriaceae bacterium]|jgi:hypothetical protein|nr:hypothetical protein [Kofleriaceae bacterium]MBP6836902.1 hypothetical protein [Kofleriaceae bacterium]MBP9205296.1 hypothetical protein [Kofleriaceae bacterium]
MNTKTLSLLSLSLLSTVGCAALLKSGLVKDGTNYAENPIASGKPLELRQKGDTGIVAEPDCETWPFEDVVTVTATEAEICIEFNRHGDFEMGPRDPAESLPMRVDADGGAGPTQLEATKVRHAKISQCFNKGYGKSVNIWNTTYRGCTANAGHLTASATYLTIGDHRWSFQNKDAAAPAGATTASASPTP